MSVQRVWKSVGSVNSNAEIERLRLELASFNKQIEQLEKQHPDAQKIEALRVSALALARQIDELRCSSANDLTDRQRLVPLLSRPERSQLNGYQEVDHDQTNGCKQPLAHFGRFLGSLTNKLALPHSGPI